MKKEFPEIDKLLKGINDPNTVLDPSSTNETTPAVEETPLEEDTVKKDETPIEKRETLDDKRSSMDVLREKYWNDFMNNLSASDERLDKDERLNCKLDRDLADSLDDCDIYNRCRSDLVNAIIRTFFDLFLPRLVPFRRRRKSLFRNYTHA